MKLAPRISAVLQRLGPSCGVPNTRVGFLASRSRFDRIDNDYGAMPIWTSIHLPASCDSSDFRGCTVPRRGGDHVPAPGKRSLRGSAEEVPSTWDGRDVSIGAAASLLVCSLRTTQRGQGINVPTPSPWHILSDRNGFRHLKGTASRRDGELPSAGIRTPLWRCCAAGGVPIALRPRSALSETRAHWSPRNPCFRPVAVDSKMR
jgi:hypothetical protein